MSRWGPGRWSLWISGRSENKMPSRQPRDGSPILPLRLAQEQAVRTIQPIKNSTDQPRKPPQGTQESGAGQLCELRFNGVCLRQASVPADAGFNFSCSEKGFADDKLKTLLALIG